MISKKALPNEELVEVTFELPASLWATKISLAGDFNGWKPDQLRFRQTRGGRWRLRLILPANRRYEFCYLIDGEWCHDASGCRIAEIREHVFNPYGSYNCVLYTGTTEESMNG